VQLAGGEGLGVSLAPALSLVQRRPDVAVLPVSQPRFSRQVSVVTLVDGPRLAPLADFIAILRQSTEAGAAAAREGSVWEAAPGGG
jgi:DNA-binding transcriptional LysR family regulator